MSNNIANVLISSIVNCTNCGCQGSKYLGKDIDNQAIYKCTVCEHNFVYQAKAKESPKKDDSSKKDNKTPYNEQVGVQIYNHAIAYTVAVDTNSGCGTGFVFADGYIMTNSHVIKTKGNSPRRNIGVSFKSNMKISHKVELIRYDEGLDLAILKFSTPLEAYTTAKFAQRDIQHGERCFAVGYPKAIAIGITEGIVSAVDVKMNNDAPCIQISAPVNSGNSGGPLFDDQKQVIGVVVSKSMERGIDNIGFAIPAAVAMRFIKDTAKQKNIEFGDI